MNNINTKTENVTYHTRALNKYNKKMLHDAHWQLDGSHYTSVYKISGEYWAILECLIPVLYNRVISYIIGKHKISSTYYIMPDITFFLLSNRTDILFLFCFCFLNRCLTQLVLSFITNNHKSLLILAMFF